jgi:hypothetical protein
LGTEQKERKFGQRKRGGQIVPSALPADNDRKQIRVADTALEFRGRKEGDTRCLWIVGLLDERGGNAPVLIRLGKIVFLAKSILEEFPVARD